MLNTSRARPTHLTRNNIIQWRILGASDSGGRLIRSQFFSGKPGLFQSPDVRFVFSCKFTHKSVGRNIYKLWMTSHRTGNDNRIVEDGFIVLNVENITIVISNCISYLTSDQRTLSFRDNRPVCNICVWLLWKNIIRISRTIIENWPMNG